MSLLKNHLLWFIVLGVLIFVIDRQVFDPLDTIVVDEALERQIAGLWTAQIQRQPTPAELDSLVADWITDEIWHREALRLNLAEDDEIIRRRMIQKMQFIAEQEGELSPSEEELVAYYEQNMDRYQISSNISFEQLLFASHDSALSAKAPEKSAADLAVASMQSRVNIRQMPREIASAFGPDFTSTLESLNLDDNWQGPVQSTFGWHLVKVLEKNPASVAALEDVRSSLIADYVYDTRVNARASFIERARSRYDIDNKDQ